MFLREPSHILILLIVVLVLFGANRLPDSARSLGRSMRIFKSEIKEMNQDEKKSGEEGSTEK
jgi:TatA/E family protein of Tat protein translocase